MVYWQREELHSHPSRHSEVATMNVYIWILELAALGGLILLVRWVLHKLKERKAHEAHAVRKQGSAASRAERDRLDIEALTRGIAEPARTPGSAMPSSGAAREERGRRAATHSAFDPDMPAVKRAISARALGSAGIRVRLRSPRYSRMAPLSKMEMSPSTSQGTCPNG